MSEANLEVSAKFSPNFALPIRDLESDRVRLTLFIPALYSKEFVERTRGYPELFKYMPYGPFDFAQEFKGKVLEKRIHPDDKTVLFAILDKTGDSERLAGVVGLLNTEVVNQCTEIGYITVFPEFQRTHVTTHAVGLLLYYCLEPPAHLAKSESDQKYGPGLGLRRVQWQTHAENTKSARAAERMGFRCEGIIRWQRVLLEGKHGWNVPEDRAGLCKYPGRHSWMGSLCWDDWEVDGAKELVRQQMDRL